MSSIWKVILVGIGLLALFAPFNITSAQFKIYSSEGAKEIGGTALSDSSSSETKQETWTRVYAPGEQQREHQQALEQQRREQQQKAAADENYRKEEELKLKKEQSEPIEQGIAAARNRAQSGSYKPRTQYSPARDDGGSIDQKTGAYFRPNR
jgi:hypothetical protein